MQNSNFAEPAHKPGQPAPTENLALSVEKLLAAANPSSYRKTLEQLFVRHVALPCNEDMQDPDYRDKLCSFYLNLTEFFDALEEMKGGQPNV